MFIPHTRQAVALSRKPQRKADSRPVLPGGYAGNAIEIIEALVSSVLQTVYTWQQHNRSRRHLARLNNHLLRDIGLTRDDIRYQTSDSFWRI
jgi:uncharacterized protein YjiS (DUF1127 family)